MPPRLRPRPSVATKAVGRKNTAIVLLCTKVSVRVPLPQLRSLFPFFHQKRLFHGNAAAAGFNSIRLGMAQQSPESGGVGSPRGFHATSGQKESRSG